jgi:hypothetical protein
VAVSGLAAFGAHKAKADQLPGDLERTSLKVFELLEEA